MRLPLAFTWALWPWAPEPPQPSLNTLEFTLKHIHAHTGAKVVLKDVLEHHRLAIAQQTPEYNTTFSLIPRLTKTNRPKSQQQFFHAREASLLRQTKRRRGEPVENDEIAVIWDEWDVPGPDTNDREALRVLAKMSWNSYIPPDDGQWYDLGEDWGSVCTFCLSESQWISC
jgi:lipase ATG15